MAIININEIDSTATQLASSNQLVVFVPGNTTVTLPEDADELAEFKKTHLFTNVTSFETAIGATPATYTDGTATIKDYGYLIAHMLLEKGAYVLYKVALNNGAICTTLVEMATAINDTNFLAELKPRSGFGVDIITLGGYVVGNATTIPTAITKAKEIVESRKDCSFACDMPKDEFDVADLQAIATAIPSEHLAHYTPWLKYGDNVLPASTGLLEVLANMFIRNIPVYKAPAGSIRGAVTGVPIHEFTEEEASLLSRDGVAGVAINPIINVNPFGYLVWGNATAYNKPLTEVDKRPAKAFLNCRLLTNRIQQLSYVGAKSILFEQNSDRLWVRFRSYLTPEMDAMKNDGIRGYKIIKQVTPNRGEVKGIIEYVPIEAVDTVKLYLIASDDVTITEE